MIHQILWPEKDFIAFQAAISLLKEAGKTSLIDEVYKKCLQQEEERNQGTRTKSFKLH